MKHLHYIKLAKRIYWTMNAEIEETRDVHVEDGENNFKMFIGFNFKQFL
jgi:hypothetical protein